MLVAVVGLTLIPPTVARLFGPQDRVHVGTYWYHEDFPVYLAAMEEAARTPSWLIHNHMTTEPHGPIMMFPLYVLIGKVAAVAGLPLLGVYAGVEILARCVLALTLYLFVAALVAHPPGRRLAFVLGTFSAGLGFWAALVHVLALSTEAGTSVRLINLYVETTTLGTFLAAPHIMLGLASILGGLLAFSAAAKGSRVGLGALAGCVLTLGLVHPFNTPVVLTSMATYVVARTVIERRIPRAALTATMVATAVGAPIVFYNYVTFTFAPVWSETFGLQNRLPSPRPWELLLDYGTVLFLAPLGILAIRGRTTIEQRVALTFLAVIAVCLYLPVPYQRRFAFGAQPALAAFAALGWPLARSGLVALFGRLGLSNRSSETSARRVLGYSLVPAAFTTALAAYFVVLSSAVTNDPLPMYSVDRDTYSLSLWLARHSAPEDVHLGSIATGASVGSVVPGRVYLGHAGVTVHGSEKLSQVAALYGGQMSADEARAFLATNGVAYVLLGPNERKLGSWDPGEQLGLEVANREGSAVAYRTGRAH
jgi:hypothetical protein